MARNIASDVALIVLMLLVGGWIIKQVRSWKNDSVPKVKYIKNKKGKSK